MDLNFTPEDEAFRAEVRAFLESRLPARFAERVRAGQQLPKAEIVQWQHILNERGWLASLWPTQYGGTGWNPIRKFIFDNECALAHAPLVNAFGLSMLGSVLIKFGTEAQKRHWLPRILDGSDWWCQGYSEPGAGSDLASLKTSAVRGTDAEGEHYIVNGQKTWTTLAHYANMIFCLVRTDREAKKQQGISFLLIDLKSPGVTVRPIITLDGEHDVNEVFFDNVRVPAENLVGEENRGWDCAKYLLTHERTGIAGVGHSLAALGRLKEVAAKLRKNGRPLADDTSFAARLARVEIDLENMKTTNLRVIATVAAGGAPGAESSMLKIRGTQIQQEIASLDRRAMGPLALPAIGEACEKEVDELAPVVPADGAFAAARYFKLRATSIYGGSNEIQRNIISKTILGL